jgi:hypothetical protein
MPSGELDFSEIYPCRCNGQSLLTRRLEEQEMLTAFWSPPGA